MIAARALAVAAFAALLACATVERSPPPAEAQLPADEADREFNASGELFFLTQGGAGTSAAFGGSRVVGPNVNLSRRDDGSWAGDFAGHSVILSAMTDGLTGTGVELHVEARGDTTTIRGIVFEQRVSLELTPKRIAGRAGPNCSLDLARHAPGVFEGQLGCIAPAQSRLSGGTVTRATLHLAGDAAAISRPMPQFALALVGVLSP
jgi:hypothetical protein